MNAHLGLSRDIRACYDDDSIEKLVRAFYSRVRADEELGPIFTKRIQDWEPHLARMQLFWAAVLRGDQGYRFGPKGPPPVMHRGIAELRMEHFERWLSLFAEEAKSVFSADAAAYIIERSKRMAKALSAHLPEPAIP